MRSKKFFARSAREIVPHLQKCTNVALPLHETANFFQRRGNVKCKFHLDVHSALVSMRARPPPNKKNWDAPAHMPAPLALPSAPLLPCPLPPYCPPNWNFLAPPMHQLATKQRRSFRISVDGYWQLLGSREQWHSCGRGWAWQCRKGMRLVYWEVPVIPLSSVTASNTHKI